MKSWMAIAMGASLGAWLRWGLSLRCDQSGWLPWGTLAANALGGLLMGMLLAWIQRAPELSTEVRLFLSTGFLGGLTTFSTFSAEAWLLLQKQEFPAFMGHITVHVVLSIALTALGYTLVMRAAG